MFKICFCRHSKIIEFLHAHFILTMSSSSPVLAPLSLSRNASVAWRGARTGLVFFLFISFYTLILNISVSFSHIVPTHVLNNCPTPFKIVLTYTSTSPVNAFRRLLVLQKFKLFSPSLHVRLQSVPRTGLINPRSL